MNYDLTLFSTIASVSSGFVAIIGGLITSKLISINGERTMVVDRISELDEIIDLKLNDAEEIKTQLEEDDALDFIRDNIESIEDSKMFKDVYQTDIPQRLEFEVLENYWVKAIKLFNEFNDAIDNAQKLNDDEIPIGLATKYMDKSFEYALCEMFATYNNRIKWSSIQLSRINNDWYNDKTKDCEQLLREVGVLQLQREQFERQKQSLTKPKNLSMGLWIFAGIILLNILMPLLFMKLVPIYPTIQNSAEIVCLIFVALGLMLTFIYICFLLGWKQNKKGNNK